VVQGGALRALLAPEEALYRFVRGDSNDSGELDLSDAPFTLSHLFLGGDVPMCSKAADSDDDGELGMSDAILVLRHLFAGGPPPSAPYPGCGLDPTEDALSCANLQPCGPR
jgi:hypothetical protein